MDIGQRPEVEVIEPARKGRRRVYSAEEKRKIVEETSVPGQSVSSVSRRFGVSPSMVFKWRRLAEEGTLSSLGADESVVPQSEVKTLKARVRELERLLGKKTMEAEILKEAIEIAREKKLLSRSPLPKRDDSR